MGKNNQNLSINTHCMLLMFYFNGCTYFKLYNDLVTILIGAQNIRLPIEWSRRAVFEYFCLIQHTVELKTEKALPMGF